MFDNVLIPPRVMPDVIATYHANIGHWRQLADDNEDMAAVLPGKPSVNGKPRMFTPLQAALFAIMADFNAVDVKAPLCARIARRLMDAHRSQPSVEQWAIVVTMNGNVSTLPYDQAGLSTGMVSGSRLAFAVTVDLKNYADRVAEVIAAAPKVIGGHDAE
jgi:hypothetical protein